MARMFKDVQNPIIFYCEYRPFTLTISFHNLKKCGRDPKWGIEMAFGFDII